MKYMRETKEYQGRQSKNIKTLINEATNGITKMNTLGSTGRSLFCQEAEIMYFKEMERFFENSISNRVMNINQDIPEIKVLKKDKSTKSTKY